MLCPPLWQRGMALGEQAVGRREGFTCTNLGQPRLFTELPGCLIPPLGRDPGAAGSCWLHGGSGGRTQDFGASLSEPVSSSSKPPAACGGPVRLWESIPGLLQNEHHLGSVPLMGWTKGTPKRAMWTSVLSPAWVAVGDATTISQG